MKRLKNFYIRNRKKLIIFFGSILIVLGLMNLYLVVDVRATSNDECIWLTKKDADSVYLYFDVVKVNGVTWNAGIRDGDILLAMNGIELDNANRAQLILNSYEAGEYAKYTVKSSDRVFDTWVYVKKLINFADLSYSLLALIWVVIGFIILLAKPDGEVQRVFFRIGAASVLWMSLLFIYGPHIIDPFWLRGVVDFLSTLGLIFLPFLLVHFFWIFPRPFKFASKKWLKAVLYLIPLLMFIGIYTHRVIYIIPKPDMSSYYRAFTGGMGTLLLISLITGLISLLISYFKIKSPAERKPLFSILLAYIIGVSSIIYTTAIAPAISDTIFNSPELYTPIILITILPVSFAFSIFRYQLMDVTIVVKNTIIYGFATILLAAIYFAVIYFIGQSISSAIGTEYQGIIAGIIFILFAMLFQSTKDRMQDFLTSKFYPEQFAYQKVLLRFSKDVTTVVGLEKILDAMSATFVDALRIRNFGIALREDQNSENFVLHRSIGISNPDMTIKEGNIQNCILEKHSVSKMPAFEQVEFTSVFPEDADKLVRENIYTAVPMIIKSKAVGIIYFGLTHSGAQFGGKDLELLLAAANQAAIAVENARLYESEAEKQRMERDLEVARKIQEGLLPRDIPAVERLDICGIMKPAMQVGGDYFDLIPVSSTKVFVIVGDVSGKGLSASLYMTKLQTIIQFACTGEKSPREILVDLNKRVYGIMERSWFVTMTLALFDTEKMKVTFCRAGHMPVLAANNGTVESFRTRGLGLGLEGGTIFDSSLLEEEISLKSNQLFAFFSDGLTETMNEKEELFGESNLIELLRNRSEHSSREVVDNVWSCLNDFRGKADQYDDMTMVVVKVK
jgi:serine phosphatase RsbU (regulator of sigma subunit)